MNMGIEPFLVASSVNLILAQRLVRRVCQSCKRQVPPHEEVLRELGLSAEEAAEIPWWEGAGCVDCNNTGYKGRQGVYEVMVLSPGLRDLILDRASATALKRLALQEGMRTLRIDGISKLKRGMTTAEEVLKETAADNV